MVSSLTQIKTIEEQKDQIKLTIEQLTERLREMIYSADNGDMIDTTLLIAVIESCSSLKDQQEIFYDLLKNSTLDVQEKNINIIEKLIQEVQIQYNDYNSIIEVLEKFQLLNTNHPDGKKVLTEYQIKASRIAECKDLVELGVLAKPFELLIDIVDHKKDISVEEEEVIDHEFSKPLPRVLYSGLLFYTSNMIVSESKANENEEAFLEDCEEQLSIQEELTNAANDQQDVPFHYTFTSNKADKPFGAKEFISDYKSTSNPSYTLFLLSLLAYFRVLCQAQLIKFILNITTEKFHIDLSTHENVLNKLLRDGYITEIKLVESGLISYCLSNKGINMFRKQDILKLLRKEIILKPKLLSATSYLMDDETLINKILNLNEAAGNIEQILLSIDEYKLTEQYAIDIDVPKIPCYCYVIYNTQNEVVNAAIIGEFPGKTNNEVNKLIENKDLAIFVNRRNYLATTNTKMFFVNMDDDTPITNVDGNEYEIIDFLVEILGQVSNEIAKPEMKDSKEDLSENSTNSNELTDTKTEKSSESINIPSSSVTNDTCTVNNDPILPIITDEQNITLDVSIKEIQCLILHNKIEEALVFSKTLTYIQEEPDQKIYQALYQRLLYATNLQLDNHKYTGVEIENLEYSDQNLANYVSDENLQLMKLSSFAWGLLLPDQVRDYTMYKFRDEMLSIIHQLFANFPSINQIFGNLFELGQDSTSNGLSNSVLTILKSQPQKHKSANLITEKAKSFLDLPVIRVHKLGIQEFRVACFGNKSEFYNCLKSISEGSEKSITLIQELLVNFTDGTDILQLHISDSKIEEFIDRIWSDVNGNSDKLRFNARKTVILHIKNILELMIDWLAIKGENSKIDNSTISQLNRIKTNLTKSINIAKKELSNYHKKDSIGYMVFMRTLGRIYDYLHNEMPYHRKWDFITLLTSYQISLDDDFMPSFNQEFQKLQGFEPSRRMLQHIHSQKFDYADVLNLIDDFEKTNWYSNYASAELINLYLYETKNRRRIDYSASKENAKKSAEIVQNEFISKLELDYVRGNIEENTKESILQTIAIFSDDFLDAGNFADYYAFLHELEKIITKEAGSSKDKLVERKNNIISELQYTAESAPIVQMIDVQLNNSNFAVAEELINRLEAGELSILDEEMETDKDVNFHQNFINKYEQFFDICYRNKGNIPYNWGFNSIKNLLNKDWQTRQKKNSEEFIKYWPKRKDMPETITALRSLLSQFDFDVKSIEKNSIDKDEKYKEKYNQYKANVIPKKRNLRDYPHPIAKFGTMVETPIYIVCLFGANSANELIDIMTNKLQFGGNTIVLMDSALKIEERRKVAEKFKSDTSSQNFFLLIDRVLLLYLATLDEGERLQAMLKCTLPYTYYQPFVNGGGPIHDEMFFGRKAELNSILNPNGACFVYGGRQLGKTALLHRASSIAHNPDEKRYAICINIFEKKMDKVVEMLCVELAKEGYKLVKQEHETLESLCLELTESFDKNRINQLQLYIDEADTFLEEISEDKYSALFPFVMLKNKTKGKFKFVLAGLHNVARLKSAMDRNSISQQLGTPLCIMPLSPADASKLVERTLSYLGFQLEDGLLSLILAKTNYYPGIIHFFCYTLVEEVAANYRSYYSASKGNPPYIIKDEQLRRVLVSGNINAEIKAKLEMTLKLDNRYRVIAYLLAYLYYEDRKNEINNTSGYSISQLKKVSPINSINSISEEDFEILLNEMVNMGILWSKQGTNLYRLRKNNFLEMIGSKTQVSDKLLEIAVNEETKVC